MRNFQDSFETHKQSFISAFSICMTVSLIERWKSSRFYEVPCSFNILVADTQAGGLAQKIVTGIDWADFLNNPEVKKD